MNAEKKNVGKVTPEQKAEIQALFERRNSLKELFMVVNPSNAELYERVIADMAETQKKFEGDFFAFIYYERFLSPSYVLGLKAIWISEAGYRRVDWKALEEALKEEDEADAQDVGRFL
jgi:hypothetical protein